MSSTQPSPRIEQPISGAAMRGARRAQVSVEAVLAVEFVVDVQAPADDAIAADVVRRRALSGKARREWDRIAESAAGALRRHLVGKGHVVSLTVARAIADEDPVLLVREGDDGTNG